MFRIASRALIALAATASLALAPAAAQARPDVSADPAGPAGAARRVPVATPRLVDVDVTERDHVDRINLLFRNGTPDIDARFVRIVRDEDGQRVRLPGRAFLVLNLDPARARAFDRDLQRVDLDNVLAFRVLDNRDDETVRVVLGLRERTDIDVTERRNRLVIDVDNDFDRD